ncbi:MAG: glycosyltransferase [Actinomycetota bacterium]|nr:glycosyltransferase [Actinomycetota bacterium]
MRVVVEGNLSLTGSYGIVNFSLGRSLSQLGHEVAFVGLDINPSEISALIAAQGLAGPNVSVGEPGPCPDVRIRQIWPPMWVRRRPQELLVVIQPWEYGSIPLEWLDGIVNVDAIWVPSEYSKRSYLQAGVDHRKVWVVPNGFDPEGITENERSEHKKKRLLFLGGTIFRKGIDILVKALDALDDKTLNGLELLVKETGGNSFYLGQSLLEESLSSHPRVGSVTTVQRQHLDRAELFHLISASDALVHPYRAEGFGLPVLEAMALGTPVIHTQGGATNEFCGPCESLLIPSTLTVADQPKVGNSFLADKCYWLEPSTEQLTQLVFSLTEGRADTEALIDAGKKRALDMTWAKVGERAEKALKELCNGEIPPDSLSILVDDVSDLLNGGDARPAPLLSRIVATGDLTTAFHLAAYIERKMNARESVEIASVRERLASISTNAPDVWSGGPYRMLVAGAEFEKVGHFGYVHDFEGSSQATLLVAKHLSNYLSHCGSIADLACGQGSMMRVLRSQGKKVQGVEADPALVKALRSDGFAIYEGYLPGDLQNIELESFDGVFLGHIVERLQPSEVEILLQWIFENIADHGTVVIQTPDFANTNVGLHNFWLDSSHIRPYPIPLLKTMLSKSGFVPLEGGCRRIPEVAPLDIIAVARRIPRNISSRAKQTTPDNIGIRIGHLGLFGGDSGFSQASRGLLDIDGLSDENIEIVRVSVDQDLGSQATIGKTVPLRFSDRIENDIAIVDVPVGWVAELGSRVRARYRIARTTFEASPLALPIQRAVSSFDEVWCFSHYDSDILTRSGIPADRIITIPPGIASPEPDTVGQLRASVNRDSFRFLSVLNFEARKNPEALVRAFCAVAGELSNTQLVLKLSGTTAEDFQNWLDELLGASQLARVKDRIHVIAGSIPRESIYALYLQCDVFVLPTRGEGYGLPFLEALAYGLPTICPDTGGHREFCNDSNSLLVKTTETPALPVAGAGVFSESFWREVDLTDLTAKMFEAAIRRDRLTDLSECGMKDAARFDESECKAASRRRITEIIRETLQ